MMIIRYLDPWGFVEGLQALRRVFVLQLLSTTASWPATRMSYVQHHGFKKGRRLTGLCKG